MSRKYVFRAYSSIQDHDNDFNYFEKVFTDHTEMKIFSSKHSHENRNNPEYVSKYFIKDEN